MVCRGRYLLNHFQRNSFFSDATSALFVGCFQLTFSPHCLLAVIDIAGKPQFFIRTHTKQMREEDARVQDFSEIYLLERNEEASVAALQNCVQNGVKQKGSICIHESNIDSAKSVLEWIKGRTTHISNRIAGPFVPGSIVWAESGNLWWPARVSLIPLYSWSFAEYLCNHK